MTATYDGRVIRLNGEILERGDSRRRLVTNIIVLPGVTASPGGGYGEGAFYSCSSLSSITLPESITSIGECAFNGCTSLSSITLPEGITSIGEHAFQGCSSLSSITLPEGITSILPGAFSGCTLLKQRSVSAGHISVESYLRFISSRARSANRRYAVLASLARLTRELYARQAKRARRQGGEDAAAAAATAAAAAAEVVVVEEQAGGLRGKLAFDAITSEDVWRYMLEFV